MTEQRLEDRQWAREQREQDLNMSREQRDHDLAIAALKRVQECDIAKRQRNMSQIQRAHEPKTTREQFRDTLLFNYI